MALILSNRLTRTPRTFSGATGDLTPPSAPVITATALSDTTINIGLTTPSTDATGIASYQLEWSPNGSTSWTVLAAFAAFPYTHNSLTAVTTYYYRAKATDASPNANIGSYSANTSATTFSVLTFDWPVQTVGYLPALPRHGGYGMDSFGGSGRDSTAGRVTVFFLDDLGTGTVDAAWPGYTRVRHGSLKGFVALTGPKILVPIKSGYINLHGQDFRPGSYMDWYGQFAPSDGLILRSTKPQVVTNFGVSTASHQRYWHMDVRLGDDGEFDPDDADAMAGGGYSDVGTNAPSQNVFLNCNFNWSQDEMFDAYYGGDLYTFLYCMFGEPLHKAQHYDEGTLAPEIHGYGPILGGGYRFNRLCIQRCIFAHMGGRQPMVAAIKLALANNIIYNPAQADFSTAQCFRICTDYGAAVPYTLPMYSNVVGNAIIKGPNGGGSIHAVAVDPAGTDTNTRLPAGSQGFIFGNAVRGWTYADQSAMKAGVFPASWSQASLVSTAWPVGWGTSLEGIRPIGTGTNPNDFSDVDLLSFATLMKASVGPRPGVRTAADRAGVIAGHILAQITGSGSAGSLVNSVAGSSDPAGWPNAALRFTPNAGGYPTLTTTTIDPFAPGSAWNNQALPTVGGAPDDSVITSGTFSNGVSKVGYTAIEAWAYEQHLFVGGK